MIGTRLGPYEITARLGEGGMGEVFRATDSKLRREVAIKVLPPAFVSDRDRLARFEREAQLLAQLNHPNIAQIYGMEASGESHALVMELVDGATLGERLERGRLSLDESLSVARQIAEALEAAHEKGIVHRDLKPQNVKVRPDGTVKVLDFGLAKAMDPATSATGAPAHSPTLMHSPTLTAAGTELGMILGTAAYMSPEQARGGVVDKRADIWAFGVVLHEMLSGEPLFAEGSVVDTLSAVMRKEIDLARLPTGTPPRVRELLRRCLERDPRARLRDVGEARIALGAAAREPAPAEAAPPKPGRASRSRLAIVSLGAIVGLGGAWLLGRATGGSPAASASSAGSGFDRFTRLTFQSGLESSPSLSPDGESVVYEAMDGGDLDLFLLRVGGQRSIHLTEDSAAEDLHAAFSPDGRSIAFRSERDGGGLFVMGATGESVRRLAKFGDNPAWSPDGREIVFATEGESDPHAREKQSELWIVSAAGGEPRRIYAGDAVQPSWSPGGQRIAFWRVELGIGNRDIWTVAADGSDARPVTDGPEIDWNPVWAHNGRALYFESDRGGVTTPWRVAIDERTGTPRDAPDPIVLPTPWSGQLSLSANDRRLVYRTSEMSSEILRLPFDPVAGRPTGPPQRIVETAIPAIGFDLSAASEIVFRTVAMQEDVYVMRSDGTGLRKLTDDAAKDRNPVWSPDGKTVAFYSNRGGLYEIWTVDRDGSNLRQRTTTEREGSARPGALFPIWSPDGRSIVYSSNDDVARLPVEDRPVPSSAMEILPIDRGEGAFVLPLSWSPDGARIAGIRVGHNGELLGGIVVYELATKTSRFLPMPPPTPPSGNLFPTVAWLADSRRGVLRWGSRLLHVDVVSGEVALLAEGLPTDRGVARISPDRRWLYMLDSHEEGDLWMASRDPRPETGAKQEGRGEG
jgi:serine/threonine protein kinase/Tol biopolymer transport system component